MPHTNANANPKNESGTRPLKEIDDLRAASASFYKNGWSYATSSNYSIRLSQDPFKLLITASGKDKSNLSAEDFVIVNNHGKNIEQNEARPSAETMLHVVAAQQPEIGSVLHTHSIWSTLLSTTETEQNLKLEGYEMLKALQGITTHEASINLRIFKNTQDIPTLAKEVEQGLNQQDPNLKFGFLIRGHGLYTYGQNLTEAKRHLEALEFLFEVEARRRQLQRR